MKIWKQTTLGIISLLAVVAAVATSFSEPPSVSQQRQAARKQMQDGNWRDAYNVLAKL